MKPFVLILFFLSWLSAADRKTILQDPSVAAAFKQRYLTLTSSWVRDVEFTSDELAAMEAGKKFESLMMQGPDDPLGKKILSSGEPSFEALAAVYPGKILDRTVLGSYSDPRQRLSEYSDEFTIYWNGAIACNLIKGRLTDRYGATGVAPVAHNTVVAFKVGKDKHLFGRVRSQYSSIGYEKGYLPIVTATYVVDGVRYRETAFAEQPDGETGGWDVAYVEFEMTNVADRPRTAVLVMEVVLNDGGTTRTEGDSILDDKGALLVSASDMRREFPLRQGQSISVALKIPYIPDAGRQMKPATLSGFEAAHQRVRGFWESLLARGAQIDVPEARVNNIWRALLLQNFVLTDGPRLTYGSGLRYNDSTYPQESGFAAHVFAMYGHADYADALQAWFIPMSVTPEGAGRKFQNRRAMVLHHLLENYRLTGKTDLFDRYKDDYYRAADAIVTDRHSTMKGDREALHWGLLPPDKPGADVQASTQTGYVIGHNITNCQGLQDFGRFLVTTGLDPERGQRYLEEAADFRKTLMSAMERAAIRVPGRPPFLDLQTLYFAKTPEYGPEPYDDLANGRLQGAYSHYWTDMELHYNFFNPGDAPAHWLTDYLHQHNGFVLGLTRSHNPGWVNTVYDVGYYDFRLRSGAVPEFLLGLYGRLAFGMSRYVYVASEGAPLIGYNTKDGGYVGAGLDIPNSASNADTLLMLRNALVMEELKDNIETGDLDLLRGAPRAWLDPGKQIRIERLPTYFGSISLQVSGEAVGVRAVIDTPARPARLSLYLRRPFRSATVNGSPFSDCDLENGVVRLPGKEKRYRVEVRY